MADQWSPAKEGSKTWHIRPRGQGFRGLCGVKLGEYAVERAAPRVPPIPGVILCPDCLTERRNAN